MAKFEAIVKKNEEYTTKTKSEKEKINVLILKTKEDINALESKKASCFENFNEFEKLTNSIRTKKEYINSLNNYLSGIDNKFKPSLEERKKDFKDITNEINADAKKLFNEIAPQISEIFKKCEELDERARKYKGYLATYEKDLNTTADIPLMKIRNLLTDIEEAQKDLTA